MTTQQVADRLVELCRMGQFETAQQELYAENATSDEAPGSQGPSVKGREAVIEKGRQFMNMVEEAHSMKIGDPIVAGNAFACTMDMDLTMKGQPRSMMSEVALYQVKDGKIISERFA